MSRTTRDHINYKTGEREKIRDHKPRCQCCCNPRHSAHGNRRITPQTRTREHIYTKPAAWERQPQTRASIPHRQLRKGSHGRRVGAAELLAPRQ